MQFEMELKIVSNEAYGYLWRVIKESLIAEHKPFYPTDPPHPDDAAKGWALDYPWVNVNRRIWFRLHQNGWKHPGILFRSKLEQCFMQFPQPMAITEIVQQLDNTWEDFDSVFEHNPADDGWMPVFSYSIKPGTQTLAHPNGKFFLCQDGEEWIMANTIDTGDYPVFYLVKTTRTFRHLPNAKYGNTPRPWEEVQSGDEV
jgi:hypothetical protein